MLLKIFKNRTVSSSGTWGTKNENNYEILNFEFPEELEEYNKRIVYYLGNQKVWDAIIDNKAILTNAITTKGSVKAYIWCTKSDEAFETDVDFRTQIFEMNFFENENADGIVPTEQQIDGFNTMLTAMNAKIDEVDALEQTIETAEAQRQEAEATRVSNENTRESNESTRESNEQTRQSQEAERERRTDEAIGNIEDKTAEYNANAEAKTTAFNNNATQKANDFNSNYTQKVNDFNTNASSKESAFNSNASSKTSAFNSNAETKTNAFNTNATNKTNDFNSNATTQTSEFNTNVESKTSVFNDNASQKTTNFDNNASEKTDEFNTNAQEKIDEYDEHIVEYQAQIDELQEEVEELSENMPWDTTEQATEINVDDAAKYSRNKLELFGNTEQTQYTGKNLFNVSDSSFSWGTLTFKLIDNIIKITIGDGSGGLGQNSQGTYTNYNFNINQNYYFSVYHKEGDLLFKEDATYKWLQVTIYIKYSDNTTSANNVRITHGMNMASVLVTFTANKTPVAFAIGRYSPVGSLQTNQEAEYYVQLEEGTEATDYEPYTGGPSPNPDYPQNIHVVTDNNTIGVTGKNLLDLANKTGGSITLRKLPVKLKPGTYVFSCDDANVSIAIRLSETNQTGSQSVVSNTNYTSGTRRYTTITTTFDAEYINISTSNTPATNMQLEEGSTLSSYEPYTHTDYPLNLGSIELCKIGDVQDYIYKENGNWYKYGAIRKYTQTNAVNFSLRRARLISSSELHDMGTSENPVNLPTPAIINISTSSNSRYNYGWGGLGFVFSQEEMDMIGVEDATEFKNYLDANLVAYVVIKPECDYIDITQITDETLIAQLEAIYNHLALVKGTNHITITPSDLEPYVTLNYMQDLPSKLDNLDSRLSLLE